MYFFIDPKGQDPVDNRVVLVYKALRAEGPIAKDNSGP